MNITEKEKIEIQFLQRVLDSLISMEGVDTGFLRAINSIVFDTKLGEVKDLAEATAEAIGDRIPRLIQQQPLPSIPVKKLDEVTGETWYNVPGQPFQVSELGNLRKVDTREPVTVDRSGFHAGKYNVKTWVWEAVRSIKVPDRCRVSKIDRSSPSIAIHNLQLTGL